MPQRANLQNCVLVTWGFAGRAGRGQWGVENVVVVVLRVMGGGTRGGLHRETQHPGDPPVCAVAHPVLFLCLF